MQDINTLLQKLLDRFFQNTLTIIQDSILQNGIVFGDTEYTKKEGSSYIKADGTTVITYAGSSSSTAYNVGGYLPIEQEFSGYDKVHITLTYLTTGGQNHAAKLYVKNVNTGDRTLLGSILGTNSYEFTLPEGGDTYVLEIYTYLYSYGTGSAFNHKLAISYLCLE